MHRAFIKQLCWSAVAILVGPTIGQNIDFAQYKPAISQGPVPASLKRSTTSTVQENIRKIKSNKADRKTKRLEQEHSIRVGFVEEELLTGGQILYGEPMSNYVEKVGLKVLESYPELSEKLQFYVLRSHVPNAYTTSGGLVFVSIGLLARIENEAQLAVVLAHEIQHYVKRHSLQTFKDVADAKKNLDGEALETKLEQLYRFSKDQELEADDLGYEMISKTEYNLEEGIYGFEVLKYSAYPFLETPIALDSFASEYYLFPDALREKIGKEIQKADLDNKKSDEKDLIDPNRTHPHLDMRILALKGRVETMDMSGKQIYIIGKPAFDEMQKIARHELLLLFMRRADHGRTLYLSRIFEILYGPTPFVSRVKSMSIYALLNHKLSGHDLDKYGCEVSSNRGMWRPLTAGIKSLDAKELSAFSMRLLWLEYIKYPTDPFIQKVWNQSLRIIQQKALLELKAFTEYQPPSTDTTDNSATAIQEKLDETPSKPLLSRPNRRSGTSTQTVKQTGPYYLAAMYGLPEVEKLKLEFAKVALDFTEIAGKRDSREQVAMAKEKEKLRYQRSNPDYSGLVLMQPRLTQFSGRNFSDNERNYFAEEKSKLLITNIWKEVARVSKDDLHILENKAKSDMKTEDINRFTQVNDWIMERLNNDTNEMILFYSQYVSEVMKPFGTPLVAWTGYDYVLYKRPLDINGLMTSIMFFPYLPVYLYFQLQTDGFTKQYTVVFNTESSKLVFNYNKERKVKLQNDYIKAHVYETLYEIRHAKQLR